MCVCVCVCVGGGMLGTGVLEQRSGVSSLAHPASFFSVSFSFLYLETGLCSCDLSGLLPVINMRNCMFFPHLYPIAC